MTTRLHIACIKSIVTMVSQVKIQYRFLPMEGMNKNRGFCLPVKDGASSCACFIKSVTIEGYSCVVTTITRRV